MSGTRRVRRVAIGALLITGIANALHYGYLVATNYALLPGHPEAYRDLQRAATWADGWMGLMAIAAAISLMRGWRWGGIAGIVAASALIHMGLLDVAFHAQHEMYARLDPVMLEMIVVDLWAFGMGAFLVYHLARSPA